MNQDYPTNILKVPHATPDPKDAAQCMLRNGRKQYNLCGEFCVAFCMRDTAHTDNIDDFLDYWQAKDLKWYQSVFQNGLARTTSIYDLDEMVGNYGVKNPSLRFNAVPINTDSVATFLSTYRAILGVQIDYSGYLVGKGIPHWIVLERIMVIDSNHAICDIYNPFTNALEPYSWKELMTSTGAYKQGLWIPK